MIQLDQLNCLARYLNRDINSEESQDKSFRNRITSRKFKWLLLGVEDKANVYQQKTKEQEKQ